MTQRGGAHDLDRHLVDLDRHLVDLDSCTAALLQCFSQSLFEPVGVLLHS